MSSTTTTLEAARAEEARAIRASDRIVANAARYKWQGFEADIRRAEDIVYKAIANRVRLEAAQ